VTKNKALIYEVFVYRVICEHIPILQTSYQVVLHYNMVLEASSVCRSGKPFLCDGIRSTAT
jgi:hypothetical protein